MKKSNKKKIEKLKLPYFERELKSKEIELGEQSEKISDLIAQIAGLTVKLQQQNINLEYLKRELEFCKGHLGEKENKLNMIKSVLSVQK